MSDLGKATIRIDVAVANIGKAGTNIDSFFNKIEKRINDIDFGFEMIDKRFTDLGNNKSFTKILKAMGILNKGFRTLRQQIVKADQAFNGLRVPQGFNIGLATSKSYTDDLVKSLDKVNKELDQIKRKKTNIAPKGMPKPSAGKGSPFSASAMNTAGSSISGAGSSLMMGAAITGAAMALIVKEGAQFEQELANVASVINGLTDGSARATKEIGLLSSKFQELGRTTEYSATEIASAGRQLALSGFNSEEITASISSISSLASATNTELEKTAQITARITRAFGQSAQASGRMADILASVAANSNTTLEGLGESFKLGAPIAAAYGQSVEDVAVAFGVLGDAGIQNSRAGTGISRLLSELTEKKGDIKELLEPFGESAEELDPMKNSIGEILEKFEDLVATGKITKAQLFDVFDQRSARSLVSLINSGADAFKSLNSEIEAGRADEIRDFRVDETIAGQFKILQSAISATAIQITTSLAPAIKKVIRSITDWVNVLTMFIADNEEFVQGLFKSIAGLVAIGAALGGLLVAAGAIISFAAGIKFLSSTLGALVGLQKFGLGLNLIRAALTSTIGLPMILIAGFFAWGKVLKEIGNIIKDFGLEEYLITPLKWFGKKLGLFTEMNEGVFKTSMSTQRLAANFALVAENVKKVKQAAQDLTAKGDSLASLGTQTSVSISNLLKKNPEENLLSYKGEADKARKLAFGDAQRTLDQERAFQKERVKRLQEEGDVFNWFGGNKNQESIDMALAQIKKIDQAIRESKDAYEETVQAISKISEESLGIFASGSDSIYELKIKADVDLDLAKEKLKSLQGDLVKKASGEEGFEDVDVAAQITKQEEAVKKLTDARATAGKQFDGLTADQISALEKLKDLNTKEFSSEKEKAAATKEANEALLKATERKTELAEGSIGLKESELKLDEAMHTLQRDTLTGSDKLLVSLNERADKVTEAFEKVSKARAALLAQTEAEISKEEGLLAGARSELSDTPEGSKARLNLLDKIADMEEFIANRNMDADEIRIQQMGDELDLLEKQAIVEGKRAEINEKSRIAQQKILDKAADARAKAEGDLSKQVEVMRRKLELEKKSQLDAFDAAKTYKIQTGELENLVEVEKERKQLVEDLNFTIKNQLANILRLKEANESLLDVYTSIEESVMSQDAASEARINREAADRDSKIKEEVEALKDQKKAAEELLKTGDLNPEDRAEIQAELKRTNDLINRSQGMLDKNEKKRSKDQKAREKKKNDEINSTMLNSRIKAAERAGDIEEELRLTRQLREQEYLNEIAEKENLSDAQRAELRRNAAEELDADLKKLEEDRLKAQEKNEDKAAKSSKKVSNTVAKEREEIEDGILKKLTDQVKTLKQAKAVMAFMAKMDSAKRARAEREGLQALSAKRRLNTLKAQRASALSEGKSTRAIDNNIARAELDLGLKSSYASQSFEAVGASATTLTKTLNILDSRLNSGRGTAKNKGTGSNEVTALTPLDSSNSQVASNSTVINIDGANFAPALAEKIESAVLGVLQEANV